MGIKLSTVFEFINMLNPVVLNQQQYNISPEYTAKTKERKKHPASSRWKKYKAQTKLGITSYGLAMLSHDIYSAKKRKQLIMQQ